MPEPQIITKIGAHYGLQLVASAADSLEEFMRYGRKEEDKNQYLLDGNTIVGLNLRTNDLEAFPFLSEPALYSLQALNLSENELATLSIPSEYKALQYLDLSDNKALSKLAFDGPMPHLKSFDCSDSGVTDLHLPDCPALKKLDVSRNRLQKVTFASACSELTWLDLSGNENLKELELPEGFNALAFLHLSKGGLERLSIPGALPALQVLDIRENHLEKLPADIILDSPLINLYAEGNHSKNIPWIFLNGDSLAEARTWFQELRDHPYEENRVVKLMLTGNGNVGKTTLMCALQSEEERCIHEEEHESTHGILIGSWERPQIEYNYWDFGGQEIYHGTHQLFLASEALQLIVFDPETEEQARRRQRVPDRIRPKQYIFNHPLEYWYETAHQLSSGSQFLIVQNKKGPFPEKDKRLSDYADLKDAEFLHVDARTGENVEDLIYFLGKRARRLPNYRMHMPAFWLRVRRFFIENLEKDSPERLISKTYFFDTLCKDIHPNSQELLFKYLHHGGFLYHHDYLGDQIIADQRWALDAIYKPLERSKEHYLEFRNQKRGKIEVRRLFEEFGGDYSDREKWLFLSFMQSCGLCFELNRTLGESESKSLSDVYVFPEFLPVQESETLKAEWARAKDIRVLRYRMPWVNYSLVQRFICRLGRKTPEYNIWRNGILVRTPEGWFKVLLDYKEKTLKILIEQAAMAQWLRPVLEEFPSNISWEIAEKEGLPFRDFDLEKWQTAARTMPGAEVAETKGTDKNQVETLNNVRQKQNPDQEIMLFLAANPAPTQKLSIGDELFFLQEELAKKEFSDKLLIAPKSNISLYDLIDRIYQEQPNILHFVGHGERENPDSHTGGGLVVFSDNRRESEVISARELKNIFEKLKYNQPQLRLVFLNACFTEPQAEAISSVGLWALGTSSRIASRTARRVATAFYKQYVQSRIKNNGTANTADIKRAAEYALGMDTSSEPVIRLFENGREVKLFTDE